MNYNDLLEAHLKYGTTEDDIIKNKSFEQILENVVIAPWWSHKLFDNMDFKIEQVGEKIFNLYRDDVSFSFIELQCVGAPAIIDFILPLGVTKCKNIIFLGSVGSLDNNIKIGDLVVPEYSICGDGASRYLNKNLEDELFKHEYPSTDYTNKLIRLLEQHNLKYHYVPNYSIDTIFAQFYHVDKIIELGAKVIEMETAVLFKCNEILKRNVTALFCVSDNTVLNKSLYSGRTAEENNHRHEVKYKVVPKIVIDMFKDK